MSETIAKKNIYDKNGVLLLAKDQKTTDAVIAKLKKHGSYEQEAPVNSDIRQSVATFSIALALGERMNIRNDRVLEYSNKVLSTVIFESKTKHWWMFVNALSNYVDWLYTHSIDVAIISLMMAVELGYTDEELWNIGLGAFLHDVGKLLIPKPIIQKPGPLNDMEMVYIRQHCELGMSSLEPFHLPKECTDIVLQHHERLDGSGYPKGLKGDEICRNARIVMIADVVDAITSGRPYKPIQEMDAAIKILRSDEGKYSKEFVSVLEKILE
ncbi:HD-GYP domain-containing protein [Desulfosporosinus metallidurans]|uniref:HD-GYP domain n=1 Tax=Desulfosporosinus metallidurans TaxID=1888891 RepID=A0A1Q8R1T4_9FIRM|nr:HD domain-containing phosphohydrolase [Desulfosporosinus metallidurans]OLN33552.1 HD-GYP domain [Desulfosporosinus metallidurans]